MSKLWARGSNFFRQLGIIGDSPIINEWTPVPGLEGQKIHKILTNHGYSLIHTDEGISIF